MGSLGYCIVREHDLRILLLAVGLVALTVQSAARLYRRSWLPSRRRPELWRALAGLTAGAGIWAVHFVAALAYLPGVPMGFALGPTAASLWLMLAGATTVFLLGSRAKSRLVHALCGAAFGATVVAMHYLGMTAVLAPGRFVWDAPTVVASLGCAVVLCAAGCALAIKDRQTWLLYLGAGVIALGVLGAHFLGMSAIAFHFDPTVTVPRQVLSRMELALLVSGVTLSILAVGWAAGLVEGHDRRQALMQLKRLSENSFEGVALLRDGIIVDCSGNFAETAGGARSWLIGQAFNDGLFAPDGEAAFTGAGRLEGWLQRLDGRALPVEVLASPVGKNQTIIAVRDLTERRQKEESLALLFNHNPAPVWAADPWSGEIMAVNPAALALYGYDEAGFRALTSCDLIAPGERDAVSEAIRAGQSSYVPEHPSRHVCADGAEILVLPYVETIAFEGRPAILTTVFDVTERELTAQALHTAKEAAEAASRAKSAFLANMSHEIRTPLNGVLAMSQAMASGELSPIQRQRLNVVQQAGEQLLHILNDILDISKIEAGRVELEALEFDLAELVESAVQPFDLQRACKGLAFELQVGEAACGRYRGDPSRIRQIIANLLSNAVKFTAMGVVRLAVTRDSDGPVRIAVSDTGEGIAPQDLSRLFDKFTQGDVSTTRRHGGTGLGLSISRELAQLMGGDIEVASQPGQGSTFTLRLPLERICDVAPADVAAARDDGPAPIELHILAAEDNAMNQIVLRTLLQQEGVELRIVANGQEALEAWRSGAFDVILMDVQMPVMDGPTATRCIREEEAGSGRARTPILGVTANVMRHQLEDYASAGMDGHVAKPIDVGMLYAALNDVLQPEPLAQAS